MNSTQILQRLASVLALTEPQILEIFSLGGAALSAAEVVALLSAEPGPRCSDAQLERFLDGLILQRRGPPAADAPPRPSASEINNNTILKKIRIALNLHEEALLSALALGGQPLSKRSLTPLFRNVGHKH